MKTVFITGGAGLIGSNVTRKLLKEGYKVVCLDPFVQYLYPFKILLKNYIDLRFEGIKDEVVFERGDVTNVSHTRKLILKYEPEYVIHLGGMPIADMSNVYVEEAVDSILTGTVNLLEILKDLDCVEKFVYISSSMSYGDFQEIPCPETHPQNPKDVYGGAKLASEVMVKTFGRRFNIPYCIVRPSAVYGPYDVNRRVSQIFVENALQGKPIRLDGGGKLVLDFTYVEDIAQGLVLALLKKESLGEIFNITYGRGYSLLEFAETLKCLIPSVKINIVEEVDENRPLRGALSIQKAKDLLSYNPQFPLEKGLGKYVTTYRKLCLFNS